jgi:hypothetical protein
VVPLVLLKAWRRSLRFVYIDHYKGITSSNSQDRINVYSEKLPGYIKKDPFDVMDLF